MFIYLFIFAVFGLIALYFPAGSHCWCAGLRKLPRGEVFSFRLYNNMFFNLLIVSYVHFASFHKPILDLNSLSVLCLSLITHKIWCCCTLCCACLSVHVVDLCRFSIFLTPLFLLPFFLYPVFPFLLPGNLLASVSILYQTVFPTG